MVDSSAEVRQLATRTLKESQERMRRHYVEECDILSQQLLKRVDESGLPGKKERVPGVTTWVLGRYYPRRYNAGEPAKVFTLYLQDNGWVYVGKPGKFMARLETFDVDINHRAYELLVKWLKE